MLYSSSETNHYYQNGRARQTHTHTHTHTHTQTHTHTHTVFLYTTTNLDPEDGTDGLSRNVGKKLPLLAA